jgi:hypothetical protein
MPEGVTLDYLLLGTIINLLKSVYHFKQCDNGDGNININNNNNNYDNNYNSNNNNNKNDNGKNDSNSNNNEIASINNTITAFLWTTKAVLQRKQIQNNEKTFNWQDCISSLLFTLITNDVYNKTKNSSFITLVNSILKQSNFPDICDILNLNNTKNNLISHLICDKMSIITSKHTYILPTQKISSSKYNFNNFNPFWQQKCWVQIAIPLLQKIIDNNQQHNSRNNVGKIELKDKNVKESNYEIKNNNNNDDKIKSGSNKNNNIELEDEKMKVNNNNVTENNEQRTFPTSCLLGLLHLSKNIPPNILSSQSSELSKVVLEALKVTIAPSSITKNVPPNAQRMESSAGTYVLHIFSCNCSSAFVLSTHSLRFYSCLFFYSYLYIHLVFNLFACVIY